MKTHIVTGWGVILPSGSLALGSQSGLPWFGWYKTNAVAFARALAAYGVTGGQPIRIEVVVSEAKTLRQRASAKERRRKRGAA